VLTVAVSAVPVSPDSPWQAPLGAVDFDAAGTPATLITVFLDRIEKTDFPAFVLAHVMVHEITHIVQGVSRHSDTGLMKARWTAHDILKMRNGPLPFTREDLDLIYRGLSTRRGVTVRWIWRNERVSQTAFEDRETDGTASTGASPTRAIAS
jgi:hypothetical protein